MICYFAKKALPLYCGNDLGLRWTRWTKAHLAQCPGCKAEYQALAATQTRLRDLAQKQIPAPPADLALTVRHKLEASSPVQAPNPNSHWGRPLAWSAAAVVVALLGIGLYQQQNKGADLAIDPLAEMTAFTFAESADDPFAQPQNEEFFPGDLSPEKLRLLLARLDQKQDPTDADLNLKYPTVESIGYPAGVQVCVNLDALNTKVVWILPKKGSQL